MDNINFQKADGSSSINEKYYASNVQMKTAKRLNINIGITAVVMIFQIAYGIGLFTFDINQIY